MANTRKRKSAVWEYFDEPRDCEEENSDETTSRRKIQCKLCNIKLADGGGTNNLKKASRGEAFAGISANGEQ